MHNKSFLKKLKPVSIGSAMADMALLLLIFFMATTTTEPPKGVEVDLPRGKTAGAEQDSIYITIARNGGVYFDGKKVTYDQLRSNLTMRSHESDRVVSLTADKNLNYEEISYVLNMLRDQNFLNIVFMSQPKSEAGK